MGGEVNTALCTVRSRGWIDHHRMDTGMRETLDVAMRKLINDVSIVTGIFIWHMPPPDSCTWKGKQGPGPDHAGKVAVAKGDGWSDVIEVSTN